LKALKENPLVKMYSEIPEELYELVCKKNESIKIAVDISRKIRAYCP